MDTLTVEQRRQVMARNRGRTRPERSLARALWCRGFRYLSGDGYAGRFGKKLPGNPDIVFTRARLVVFVDGCFWHGCRKCGRVPKSNRGFWKKKFAINLKRDRAVSGILRREGWAVIRVPEHDIRTQAMLEETASRIARQLAANTH